MILERTEHPGWLSNSYLLVDHEGGSGVLVDSNGIAEPLLATIERHNVKITHVLLTHGHEDHVVDCEQLAGRVGAELVGHPLLRDSGIHPDRTIEHGDVIRSGGLELRAIATPGHCADHLAILVDGTDCLTADCLFQGTVGGTAGGGERAFEDQRHSIMAVLMGLPRETRVHPGHAGPTTIGIEWESNPFVRIWRGADSEGEEECLVRDEPATLVLWGPNYDGTHKAWVRYAEGRDAIVGGSQVVRTS